MRGRHENGKRTSMLTPMKEYDGLVETIELLADQNPCVRLSDR